MQSDGISTVEPKLAQWFLRRRLKCEKLTTDDEDDDGQNLMAKAHMVLGQVS